MSSTITARTDESGQPHVVWDMPADLADSVKTILHREDLTETATTDESGQPHVVWDMPVDLADSVMTLLAREDLAHASGTTTLPEGLLRAVAPLYAAVSDAFDMIERPHGCPDLWPDAATMPLDEPALLGSVDGALTAVLIPGTPNPVAAVALAVETAREYGINIDENDASLVADVSPARWVVLNKCESADHDFHPELAPHGPRTTGAIQVTQVDLHH